MKTIELNNFKKFEHLPEKELGFINLLVGKCNSGKSSFSQAAISFIDNLLHIDMNRDEDNLGKLNIFFQSKRPTFHFKCEDVELDLGQFNDIIHKGGGATEIILKCGFDFKDGGKKQRVFVSFTIGSHSKDNFGNINKIAIESYTHKFEFSFEEDGAFGYCSYLRKDSDTPIIFKSNADDLTDPNEHLLIRVVRNIIRGNESEKYELTTEDIKIIENLINMLFSVLDQEFNYFGKYEEKRGITYIPAFYINTNYEKEECYDNYKNYKNLDYFRKTLNDFIDSKISLNENDEDKYGQFVNKMMEKFGLGSLIVEDQQCFFVEDKRDCLTPLHLSGKGAIRLITIILRLAICIKEKSPLVFIEEPEQNLHPNLQSLLADLLFDAYLLAKRDGQNINFIVETHSEYLVRRSQLIVKKCCEVGVERDSIPFKTFYFPDDGKQPFDMEYNENGSFSKDFGPGFTDESAKLAINLIR